MKHFSLGLKKLDFVFNDRAELWSGTLKLLGVLVFLPLGFIWLLGSFGMIPIKTLIDIQRAQDDQQVMGLCASPSNLPRQHIPYHSCQEQFCYVISHHI